MHIRIFRGVLLRRRWDQVRASYWFVPLITAVIAFFFGQFMLWVDGVTPDTSLVLGYFVVTTNADEGRTILFGLSGTILATAGIVFSMLTVPLSLAASQFGSRLLRLYLRNSTTQFVLGLFVGTFIYCLTAALSIPLATTTNPQWTTAVGLLLAVITFGSLIVLIQNIATSLQAPNMVAAASSELHDVLRQATSLAERATGGAGDEAKYTALLAQIEQEGEPILGTERGYIQAIDPKLLLPLAEKYDLIIRLVRKPGDFIQHDELVALVWPPQRVNRFVADAIHHSYELGNLRTPAQDIEYAVNQLVEVAVRAMSPAINDPFTAGTCLDHLGAGLALYAEQNRKTEDLAFFYDQANQLRLVVDALTFTELLDAAFNMLRRASRENADVLLGMLAAIETISHQCPDPAYLVALRRHVQLVEAEYQASTLIQWDRERVGQACASLLALLNG